jgi:DNA helicase HerA-like ATPase
MNALVTAVNDRASLGDWVDAELEAILNLYSGAVGSGFRLLEPLRPYHSTNRTDDYADEILRELILGKIVIVDLSLGSETILKFCSERIINYILQDAARRFSEGREPVNLQIYIEEAHRLFDRDRMNAPSETDPYVRLAKEAAKYRIGLIYATQEVSSVDPLILSNTSNWIVTHLNNKAEVKELAKYYDFEDFADLTLKAEDVGFARVKTRSGRYIIPAQIDLFDETRVQAARQACLSAQNGHQIR